MKKALATSLLGTVLLLVSFQLGAQKIETVDGVRVVHNEKTGQWGASPQVHLELIQTIGDLNTEDENLAFNSPRDVALDPAGNIYILDAANQRIQKFSPEVKYLATFGRKGQGPGEFNYPSSLDIDSQGKMYVLDSFVKKIQILTPEGKEQKTILILKDQLFKSRAMKSGVFAAGAYPMPSRAGDEEKKDSGLFRLVKLIDHTGNAQKEFGSLHDYGDSMTNYYANIFQFDIDGEDNILLSFINQNRVEKYSPDGRLLWRADRPLNYRTGVLERAKIESSGRSYSTQAPKMNTVSAGIGVDEKGRAWVVTQDRQIREEEQVYTMMVGGSGGVAKVETKGNRELQKTDMYKLEIFSPDGILLGAIPLDHFVDSIRIIRDNLFLIDSGHGAKIYHYRIIEH
jgi:DNA-binding beta-propeller fold protein YncE